MWEECIRCNEAPAVDEQGYCGHCHWAVRAEVEEGFYALREYLRAWARFDEWCETRERSRPDRRAFASRVRARLKSRGALRA